MHHRLYLVSYDISDPARLRRVHRTCRGYGDAVQYSVFVCTLTERGLATLRLRLERHLNHREDQVLIIDVGPAHDRTLQRFTALGRAFEPRPRRAHIV